MGPDQNDDMDRLAVVNAEQRRSRRFTTVFAMSLGFCLLGTVACIALVLRSFSATGSRVPWSYSVGRIIALVFLVWALGLVLKGIATLLRRFRAD